MNVIFPFLIIGLMVDAGIENLVTAIENKVITNVVFRDKVKDIVCLGDFPEFV